MARLRFFTNFDYSYFAPKIQICHAARLTKRT
jgi:hypothetical protein